MAILAEERQENVERALFAYISTNYTLTAKWLEGENSFDTRTVSEYVEFSVVGEMPNTFHRQVSPHNTRKGNTIPLLVQAVISQKPTTNITRTAAIRDTITNLLRRAKIQILDRVGGSNSPLGYIFGEGLIRSMDAGEENDMRKYALLFRMDYLEEFEP